MLKNIKGPLNLLILTTALNRPRLHARTFRSLKRIISKDTNVTWIINIDCLDLLYNDEEQTKKKITSIYEGYNVNFIFNIFKGRGNFLNSVKKLISTSKEYVDKVDYIFYWEDDYYAKEEERYLDEIINDNLGKNNKNLNFTLNLAVRKRKAKKNPISFQPTIWSKEAFKPFIKAFEAIDPNYDSCPEYYLANNYNKFGDLDGIVFKYEKLLAGCRTGRVWMEKRGLKKRDNYYEIHNKFTYYGYKYNLDKVTYHEYDRYYNRFLPESRKKGGAMLEIGIDKGGSLKMWEEIYPNIHIYGIDINTKINKPNITIFKGDQSKINFIRSIYKKLPNLFLIIDDGSHVPEHQLLCFNTFFPLLEHGGVYIIEDIETSYWVKGKLEGYKMRYGYRNSKSIVEIFKNAVDAVNSNILGEVKSNVVQHQRFIESIFFGENCIIIEKNNDRKKNYKHSYNLKL